MIEAIKSQPDILDLFPEPKYDELKEVMNAWLNPEEAQSETVTNSVVDEEDTQPVAVAAIAQSDDVSTKSPTPSKPASTGKSPSASSAKSNTEDLTKAFDNLFSN
jgi:hypothetical protein